MPPPAVQLPVGPSAESSPRTPHLLIPVAALLAILPLLIHGTSCGHDLGFHLLSWFDAAAQIRHGHYPLWAIAPAWNAGEPRFLFYPPLSWLLGAILTLLLPAVALPYAFLFIALTAAGLAMHRLAREFASPTAALLAAAFYLANPYMLFNAFERSAFAELLAATWMPLLLLAILRARPTVRGIAVPLALLWLTNAPSAVMGSYMLALLAIWRVATSSCSRFRLALTCIAGTLLGLALPAFYLIPAAYQRRFIQVDMAIIPNMRFQDNFLFDNTTDTAHNGVNHSISLLALAVLALTIILITALLILRNHHQKSIISTKARSAQRRDLQLPLTLLTLLIAFLLFPISTPIWQHLPDLAFLQFPWRLLTILSAVLALTFALLIDTSTEAGAPFMRSTWRMSGPVTTLLTLALPLTLGFLLYAHTAQACEDHFGPVSLLNILNTHHGIPPTDEYTPNNADNDLLRTGNPAFWLAAHPNDPAPNTLPTPAELNPSIDTDDTPVPLSQTLSTPAPHHLQIHTNHPTYLILNLRDYPNWDITATNPNSLSLEHPAHTQRNDGLIALTLNYPSDYTIDIHWHRTLDQTLGLILSTIALIVLLYPILKFFRLILRPNPPGYLDDYVRPGPLSVTPNSTRRSAQEPVA